jgi:hypothetical protein
MRRMAFQPKLHPSVGTWGLLGFFLLEVGLHVAACCGAAAAFVRHARAVKRGVSRRWVSRGGRRLPDRSGRGGWVGGPEAAAGGLNNIVSSNLSEPCLVCVGVCAHFTIFSTDGPDRVAVPGAGHHAYAANSCSRVCDREVGGCFLEMRPREGERNKRERMCSAA